MKKYATFGWVIEGTGWFFTDTIEQGKNEWCFGRMIFEINSEDEIKFKEYGTEVKSNRLMIERLKEMNCPIVYQEGEPPEIFISK